VIREETEVAVEEVVDVVVAEAVEDVKKLKEQNYLSTTSVKKPLKMNLEKPLPNMVLSLMLTILAKDLLLLLSQHLMKLRLQSRL